MRLRFTPEAAERLERIREYLRDCGRDEAGRRLALEVVAMGRRLCAHPELGSAEAWMAYLGRGHRSMPVGKGKRHKIVYVVGEGEVTVTDVFDVRQDPGAMRGET